MTVHPSREAYFLRSLHAGAAHRAARRRSRPAAVSRPAARERPASQRMRRGVGKALGVAAVMLVLAIYFAWVCLQMAGHVDGGDALLLEIFLPIVIALVFVAVGFRPSA